MATIKIKNLKLKAIIGIFGWERRIKQSIIINVSMDYDASRASKSDRIEDTVDYKAIKKNILKEVESSRYFLLEKLAAKVLDIVMDNKKVKFASVEIDKPKALRFADSVSVTLHRKRP